MTAINEPLPIPLSQETARPDAAARPRHKALTHMPALDGVRGAAILLVMLHHLIPAERVATGGWLMFDWIREAAWCGVDLFFVLSGFLITGILYDNKEGRRYFSGFFGRRALRIFPLQYGVLIVVLLIIPAIKPISLLEMPGDTTWLWFYASNISLTLEGAWHYGLLDHFWSLAVEEHFYLVWPFVVYFLSRRSLVWVCVGCIVTALGLRIGMTLAGFEWVGVYVFTPCRMDGLAYGSLLALLVRSEGGWARHLPLIRGLGVVAAVGLVGLLLVLGRFSNEDPVVLTIGLTLLVLLFGSLVMHASHDDTRLGRLFNKPWLRVCGLYSYGLYVFNQPIDVIVTHSNFFGRFHFDSYGAQMLFSLVVGTVLTFAIAVPSFHLFERQFLRLKRYVG